MLKIRSTNNACYISLVTGEIARVCYDKKGKNHYEFVISDSLMDAHREYKNAMRSSRDDYENLEDFFKYCLKVEPCDINYYFNMYKDTIRKNNKES